MALPSENMDKLLFKCRNRYARQYIQEAIQCYQVGAFRAAILSVWTAVTVDLFEKLKELAAAGDTNVDKLFQHLEQQADISDTIEFAYLEKDFITIARDKFELISHADSIDLLRLQQDRKRCIRSSLNSDDKMFSPTGELVKIHIFSAVNNLLQYPVYYGKDELDLLINNIESPTFPINKEQIVNLLKNSVLAHVRSSLFKEFFIYLIRKCISQELTIQQKMRYYMIFNTTIELYWNVSNKILQIEIPKLTANIKDKDVDQILYLISYGANIWSFLDSLTKQKVSEYVMNLPINDIKLIKWLLSYSPLKKEIRYRIHNFTQEELLAVISNGSTLINPIFIDRAIDFYTQSNSFEFSNDWVIKYYGYIDLFTPNNVERIIVAAGKNNFISGSYNFEELMIGMRSSGIIPYEKFDELMNNYGIYDLFVEKIRL